LKTRPENSQTIDDAAADWVARVERGPLSDEDTARLDAWLAGDVRRQGAYARAQVVLLHAQRARGLGADFTSRRRPRGKTTALATRRGLLAAGGGALAASVVGGVALSLALRGTAYATARGEVRRIPLSGGSAATLNTASRIVVSGRRVTLDAGEVLFDMASGDDEVFAIALGDSLAEVRRATFLVQKLNSKPIRLLVDTGELRLAVAGAPAAMIGKDTEAQIDLQSGRITARPLSPEILAREQAWRNGKLAFEGQSLAYAAAQFARYGDPQIQITDPALAAETVVGLFSINDPAGFAQAMGASLDANVRTESDRIILSR
jgi:transmembrane sensor